VSSGAATKQYAGWSSYGSAKATYNSISGHIAIEEPDITSVAVAPGRVDTEMQGVIRAEGKESMNKAQYDSFVDAKEEGILLKPEQPGHVMAKFVADPLKELSGKFFSYVSRHVVESKTNGYADGTHQRLRRTKNRRAWRYWEHKNLDISSNVSLCRYNDANRQKVERQMQVSRKMKSS
jgi:NAD(P)-dependent dehydrogenase (short-subunit alcohol dehydrogenase family)